MVLFHLVVNSTAVKAVYYGIYSFKLPCMMREIVVLMRYSPSSLPPEITWLGIWFCFSSRSKTIQSVLFVDARLNCILRYGAVIYKDPRYHGTMDARSNQVLKASRLDHTLKLC